MTRGGGQRTDSRPGTGSTTDSAGAGRLETDAIADLGVDYAFRLRPDGTVEAVSGEVERLVGEPAGRIVGEQFQQYVTERSIERALEAFERVLGGETVRGTPLRLTGDGTPLVEVNAEPVREDGEVVAVRGAAREATDRRQTIERQAKAMEGAIDGMALLDDAGHYRYVNEAHAELYGYERAELVGSHWTRLYDEDERRRLEREALPEMESTGRWRGTAVGRRRDGSTFQQVLSLSALDDGLTCVVRDITDRHQREQIIEVLDRVLRHNLRNDMNVVMGEAERIARATDGEPAAAAGRIENRARSLLAVSDTARTVREVVTSDEGATVTDLRRIVRRTAAHRERVEADLPDRPVRVACSGVEHAVEELVENAVEHGDTDSRAAADHDGDRATVHIELGQGAGGAAMAVLRVVDDGPGIPRMERVTLEEGHETPLQHGQGLGLWLANWVATQVGGEFAVRERPGGGTVVELRLPLAESDAE